LQSSKHVEDGVKLGCWINYQRKAKKKGTLYPERITRLEKLGIVFKIKMKDASEDQWDNLLVAYKERE